MTVQSGLLQTKSVPAFEEDGLLDLQEDEEENMKDGVLREDIKRRAENMSG